MVNLEQARRRAKELLAEQRRTDPRAKLTAAQHAVAGGLGYRAWPDLVRATEVFDPVDGVGGDGVPWGRVRRVTIICFVEDAAADGEAVVALYRNDDRWVAPAGDRRPGEDVWDDSVLRIPLETMGFRRQGTHALALDGDRRHVVFWVDGGRYDGARPHRDDAEWWTGSAADAVALLTDQGDAALARLVESADRARRSLGYDEHAADLRRTLVGCYLRAETAEVGSGFGGSRQDWSDARGVLADALDPDRGVVRFLDHCCANGHLAMSMVGWGAERGIEVEPYGVDIAPELVELARRLNPELADRFFVGDALNWRHPDGVRFDLVHMVLDVLPTDRHAEVIRHLLDHVVAADGRLLLSDYGETPPEPIATRLGHPVAGRTAQPTQRGKPRGHPSVWIDPPA